VSSVLIDCKALQVVDSHCHAFSPERESQPFERYITLSGLPIDKGDLVNTLLYRILVSELRRLLKVEGSHTCVVEERNLRYKQDPRQYIKALFQDAGIEAMLVDTGYPSELFSGYSVPLDEFSAMVQCRVHEIYRVENLVIKLLNDRLSLDEATKAFNHTIDSRIEAGAVSFKSVIAYRTGLAVQKRPYEEVKRAHKDVLGLIDSEKEVMDVVRSKTPSVKKVFDFFLYEAAQCCSNHHVPLQIHVGIGDVPGIDLRTSNPLQLQEFLADQETKEANIILTHGGYPYLREAGFLAATHPNVYIDFSETLPFVSVGASNTLLNLLEMTPVTKLMYGSDCFNVPELAWIAALIGKRALASTLNSLVEKWCLHDEWALEAATGILAGNAKRIYKLPK
jgi:predicted TIM-barrel fold metal-dependent hydrolase